MKLKAEQSAFLAQVGEASRGIIARAFAGTSSPRSAIKAKCLDCCHFDREEVASCTVVLCPLHDYRPYQKRKAPLRAAPVRGAAEQTDKLSTGTGGQDA